MITGIDFVWLPVVDMARAKAFYQETLGLRITKQGESWAEFDLGEGPAIGLIEPNVFGLPAEPAKTGSVAIALRDFDGMVESFKAHNHLKSGPHDGAGCHSGFGTDSEGNSLVIHQRKAEPRRDREVDFVMLPVADMARARAFYEGTLGLKPETVHEQAWTEYVLPDDSAFALGDVRTLGMEFAPVRAGALGLRTPDLEEVFDRLVGQGLATANVLEETPICQMGFVHDTEGNALVLHRLK